MSAIAVNGIPHAASISRITPSAVGGGFFVRGAESVAHEQHFVVVLFKYPRDVPSERDRVMVSIKADRSTHMRIISDVRQALRQAGVRRISLSATGVNDKLIQK